MNKKIILVIVVLVLVVGGYMIYKNNNAPFEPENFKTEPPIYDDFGAGTTPITDDTVKGEEKAVATVKEFTVDGSNFKFAPSTITVKKGDTVKITLKNIQGFHDFRIDAFKVATKQIKEGTTETVTFVADKAGSFEYYCSVGKHKAMGMVGTLTVE